MEVIVYSSKNCGWCTKQKDFLLEKGISFEEKDVENHENFKEFEKLGGQGTPFTVIKTSGKISDTVSGFNKEKLTALLFQ